MLTLCTEQNSCRSRAFLYCFVAVCHLSHDWLEPAGNALKKLPGNKTVAHYIKQCTIRRRNYGPLTHRRSIYRNRRRIALLHFCSAALHTYSFSRFEPGV